MPVVLVVAAAFLVEEPLGVGILGVEILGVASQEEAFLVEGLKEAFPVGDPQGGIPMEAVVVPMVLEGASPALVGGASLVASLEEVDLLGAFPGDTLQASKVQGMVQEKQDKLQWVEQGMVGIQMSVYMYLAVLLGKC